MAFWGLAAVIALLMLIWMIGFSEDARWLRIGGFIVLAVKWVAPAVAQAAVAGGPPALLAKVLLVSVLGSAALVGGYMLFWAIRTHRPVGIRLALGLAGLVTLAPLLRFAGMWAPLF